MKQRDHWDLRGCVRACRLQRTWYSLRCGAEVCETEERGDITSLEFRADGSLSRRWHFNPDGSEWTATYEYNDAGRLASVRTESPAGLTQVHFFDYDEAGRPVRVRGDRVMETYGYDAAGRKQKTLHVDLANQTANTLYAWGAEGTDSSYSAPGTARLTTLYNERDQPTQLLFYDANEHLISKVSFTYNTHGNLVEEAQTKSAETVPSELVASLSPGQREAVLALFGASGEPVRRTHQYNDEGRRSESCSRVGLLGGDRKIVAYNIKGDVVEEICERDERDFSMDPEGRLSDAPTGERKIRSEARFHYEYDAEGNWVTKTVEIRGGTQQEFIVSTVGRRTIEYE